MHFSVKLHKKDQHPHAQICRYLAYFFERFYKFNVDDPIVLLFDMSDAGYSNLDMDMIKFVVTCLQTYYPGLIGTLFLIVPKFSCILFSTFKYRLHDYLSNAFYIQWLAYFLLL